MEDVYVPPPVIHSYIVKLHQKLWIIHTIRPNNEQAGQGVQELSNAKKTQCRNPT